MMKLNPGSFFLLPCAILMFVSCTKNVEDDVAVAARLFEEVDGLLAVEAEHYHTRSANDTARDWYVISVDSTHVLAETNHASSASAGAYLEGLPDTRTTHDDSLIVGTNFYPVAGVGALLSYNVWINTPGLYTVWVRAYSTGTEDNGIHVGIDGTWPESGQRVQWCEGKNQWTWSAAQRTEENHCGVPKAIQLDVKEAGQHAIQFSMREDGFEFDKWIMALDSAYTPEGSGPEERIRQ